MDGLGKTTPGFTIFLPWVKLPYPVSIGAFRFVPVDVKDADQVFGSDVAPLAINAMRTHVDQGGKPIASCTVVLRPRASRSWDVGRNHVDPASRASELLSLCCLSEQQFFRGHFAAHLNASMFRPIGMPLTRSQDITLLYPRRGMSLRVGGRTFSNTMFQQPPEVEGTRCDEVNVSLLRGLLKAKHADTSEFAALESALQFFLLANSESMDLDASNCLMLSAIAFERLLTPPENNAQAIAEAFAKRWEKFGGRALSKAKRVKPDNARWANERLPWPIHRKWMKELYEHRSSTVHRGLRNALSSNWSAKQHMVIAAFVFPLLLKVMLREADYYSLTDDEEVACEKLDDLLDSNWGDPKHDRVPEWTGILSDAQSERGIRRAIERAIVIAGSGDEKSG